MRCRVGAFYRDTAVDLAFGEVDRVHDVSVFKEVDELVYRHKRAVILRFGRRRAKVGQADNAFRRKKGFVREIRYVAGNFPFLDPGDDIRVVDESAAREVEDADAFFHDADLVGVDESLGVVGLGHVNGNIVRFREERVEVFRLVHGAGERPGCVDRDKRVITDNVHAEADCVVRDHCADRAESDDSECFSFYFRADELAFSLFGEIRDFVTPCR